MATLPFGVFAPDLADLDTSTTASILNCTPRGDGYGPFQDFAAFTAGLPDVCRGYFIARNNDGSVTCFAGTSTNLYVLDNGTLDWNEVSKDGADYAGLPTDSHWQFAQFNSVVLATQPNVALQRYTLGSSTEFEDVAGSPPQARFITIVGRFVVLSGLLNNPFRVHWSALNDITGWTPGLDFSDYQDLPDGGRVLGVAGGEYGIILQESAIRRMTQALGSPLIFQIDRLSEDMGLYAPYSIVRAADTVLFLSSRGFQQISPGGYPVPIGKEKVDRTFFDDLDNGNLQLLIGAADPKGTRAYWAYKSNDGTAGQFDKMLGYDIALQQWFMINQSGQYLATLVQPPRTLESLDEISGSLDDLPQSLDDYSTAALAHISKMDENNRLGFFNGPNMEAVIETGEKGGNGKRAFVRGVRPITDAPSVYCSVSKRENLQSAMTYSPETAINIVGKCPQRSSARYSRIRVRIPAETVWTYATGVEPDVVQEGDR